MLPNQHNEFQLRASIIFSSICCAFWYEERADKTFPCCSTFLPRSIKVLAAKWLALVVSSSILRVLSNLYAFWSFCLASSIFVSLAKSYAWSTKVLAANWLALAVTSSIFRVSFNLYASWSFCLASSIFVSLAKSYA